MSPVWTIIYQLVTKKITSRFTCFVISSVFQSIQIRDMDTKTMNFVHALSTLVSIRIPSLNFKSSFCILSLKSGALAKA